MWWNYVIFAFFSVENKPFDVFPCISHVQQQCDNPIWNLPAQNFSFRENSHYSCKNNRCSNLINTKYIQKPFTLENLKVTTDIKDIRPVLNEIKSQNPDYPVYKSFRLLNQKSGKKLLQDKQEDAIKTKKRRGRPKKNPLSNVKTIEVQNEETDPVDYGMWTEKYKPKSSEDIIGNAKAIKTLKMWLESWKTFSQEIISNKTRRNSSSSEFETTDCDSRDSSRLPDNTIILGGPSGSGKSAAVYAICNELGFNVIELNASSKRTGKIFIIGFV